MIWIKAAARRARSDSDRQFLAFALSFDEVIVTTFTAGQRSTLPNWMLSELVRPRQRPITNVVAVFVIAVTFLPILLSYYLTRHGHRAAA